MNRSNRGRLVVAGLALVLGLAPAHSVRAQSGAGAGKIKFAMLDLPLQGVVSNAGCASIDFADGSVHFIVVAFPNSGPGGGVLAHVHVNGILMGMAGGMPYLGIIMPFEGTLQCAAREFVPPEPCAQIGLQIYLLALGPSGFEPPDPCFRQMATGTLSLTLNADGSVESADAELNSAPT